MRKPIGTLVGVIAALALALSAYPISLASADPGDGNGNSRGQQKDRGQGGGQAPQNPATNEDPGGNNGTVKIHDPGTGEEIHANRPHPGCSFYIVGFNFDGTSSGWWQIGGHAPTASNAGSSGTWGPSDADGHWSSPTMSNLVSGHYKLYVKQTNSNTPPGGEKQKVFWIECQPSGNATPNNTTDSSTTTPANTTTGGTSASDTNSSQQTVAGFQAIGSTDFTIGSNGTLAGANRLFELQDNLAVDASAQPAAIAGVQSLPSTSTAAGIRIHGSRQP